MTCPVRYQRGMQMRKRYASGVEGETGRRFMKWSIFTVFGVAGSDEPPAFAT